MNGLPYVLKNINKPITALEEKDPNPMYPALTSMVAKPLEFPLRSSPKMNQ